MRCKQGDLAIVVKSESGNLGKIVQCLRVVEDIRWRYYRSPVWLTNTSFQVKDIIYGTLYTTNTFPDCCLHPLRGEADDLAESTTKELETV